MIRRIGVLCQGPNDRGFLMGLRDRLNSHAVLLFDPKKRGKTKTMVWKQVASICKDFRAQGANLLVRLTDAGESPWRDLKQQEWSNFPEETRSILICGAMPGAVEVWLAQDRRYLDDRLGIPASDQILFPEFLGRVKSAIQRDPRFPDCDEVVRSFVAEAPPDVFRRWLQDESFKSFYIDCRDAARREPDCPVHDELCGGDKS